MSVASNESTTGGGRAIEIPDATVEPAAYVQALLSTLGSRDPLTVCADTPNRARRLCSELRTQLWMVPMGPGEWNALQVVGHLFDVDVVYGFRWRLALTEEGPTYPGYNEKAWSALPRPAPNDMIDAFVSLRNVNLELLRRIAPADWDRRGIHGEQGPEDVRRMVQKVAGHDLAHLNQLERTVAVALAQPGRAGDVAEI
jgi:hypothetical protein